MSELRCSKHELQYCRRCDSVECVKCGEVWGRQGVTIYPVNDGPPAVLTGNNPLGLNWGGTSNG